MTTNYVLLLPPSEAKIENINKTTIYSDAKKTNSFRDLNPARNRLYKHLIGVLTGASLKDLSDILELRGVQLQKAIRSNFNLDKASTLPAIHRYVGIMFKYINYYNMKQKQKTNFNLSTLFIDGMFGILRPLDLIPDYKLKITSKLAGLNVMKYWKGELGDFFMKEFEGKVIIDILPDSHRKVLPAMLEQSAVGSQQLVRQEYYQILFAEEVGGKLRNAGHFSKKLKGEFVNFICSLDDVSRGDLERWEHSDGFRFSEKYSSDNRIVYLKK